jgi:hypothetical protein
VFSNRLISSRIADYQEVLSLFHLCSYGVLINSLASYLGVEIHVLIH